MIYKFFGGRKMFIFYLLLLINTVAYFTNQFSTEFGYFCIYLYGVIVMGNVGSKIVKR
jgi:hypothetical protein